MTTLVRFYFPEELGLPMAEFMEISPRDLIKTSRFASHQAALDVASNSLGAYCKLLENEVEVEEFLEELFAHYSNQDYNWIYSNMF